MPPLKWRLHDAGEFCWRWRQNETLPFEPYLPTLITMKCDLRCGGGINFVIKVMPSKV